ncbi:uncharacterized protein qrfp [Antennarius striatus]|uniref:uncharacterized protein qrfp n=1 Tax=Antennarius striatus TaxID=241820 RepID=UPI0035AD8E25
MMVQRVRAARKMRLSFHLGASNLTFLFLALLCSRHVTSFPHSPTTLHPMGGLPQLEATLLGTRVDDLMDDWTVRPAWRQDPWLALLRSWMEDELLRGQTPGGPSVESLLYQGKREREVEEGGKRNEALTSIAGGLQAVSREKGGFGFRFGRKRWTEEEDE